MSDDNKNSNIENEEESMSRVHGRSKSIFDQMELSGADGTVKEIKNKYEDNEDEITKAVIEKMKLDQSWYNSKGIDTSSMANDKYKEILNSIPLKPNNVNNDEENIQTSMEDLKLSDNNETINTVGSEDNCKTISGNQITTDLTEFSLNDPNINNVTIGNCNDSIVGDEGEEEEEEEEDDDDDDDGEEDYESIEIPKKGVAIKKLSINPAILDQDSYATSQCYSPVYSIKSYSFNNTSIDVSVKNSNVSNIVTTKGKPGMNKSPQIAIADMTNKPQSSHNVNTSISTIQSPYTPLLNLNSPITTNYTNSSSSSPLSNETTPKTNEPNPITSNNVDALKAHSVQSSPFVTNVPPQHTLLLAKTSISAPSTTTSTPTTINVKKSLQSPSILFQNKNKLSNITSNVNGKYY